MDKKEVDLFISPIKKKIFNCRIKVKKETNSQTNKEHRDRMHNNI